MTDLRLALPAVAAWLASAVLLGLPGAEIPTLIALWIAAIAGSALSVVRPAFATVALACAAAALCVTSLAVQSPTRDPLHSVPAGRVTVEGVTTATLHVGGERVRLEVTRLDIGGEVVEGAIPLLAFVDRADAQVALGSTVIASGRLKATAPGESVSYLMFADSGLEVTAGPPWFLDWANSLRSRFAHACANLPGQGGDLLAGLAIGDTSRVDEGLDAAMKASSLSHLTAVSGANCAIVVGLVLLVGSALGIRRGVRISAALCVLIGFVVLVTPEPSVLRAAVMATVVLVTVAGGRQVAGIPVLALGSLVLLVGDPWLAREYGFVLSVLATAGLIGLSAPLALRLQPWLGARLSLVLAVPLAAQLACQPVLILLDPAVPTYGVVANVLAEPAAPVATVVGLAACILLTLLPPLGEVLLWVAWVPSAWIAAVAGFFASAPLARLPWPEGWPGAMLLAGITVLALLAFRHRWARWATAAAVATAIAISLVTFGVSRLSRPPDWQIAMCDVGQGDATIVRSAGVVALIDTGPAPGPLAECLSDLGVARIDLLVLTHFDLDHVGGTSAVRGRVGRVLVGPPDGASSEALLASLERAGAVVEPTLRGDAGSLGDLRWTAVWPAPRLDPGNDASVVLRFEAESCPVRCLSLIALGDLGAEAQTRLLRDGRLDPVDVVKVSHHGSADQHEGLYERLAAAVGIVGVGKGNGYGHPTDDALDLLERAGTRVVRTDRDGLILIAPEGDDGAAVWTRGPP